MLGDRGLPFSSLISQVSVVVVQRHDADIVGEPPLGHSSVFDRIDSNIKRSPRFVEYCLYGRIQRASILSRCWAIFQLHCFDQSDDP